ncbi:DUF1853 family protein [Agarivorans sp. Alg241-V36]|uniref:DUF1853 family protein n=1 Tax=Agarivorans sp. Alg241-V36 TaxID=2305992 RepID=UPI0013D482E6|nr:DUF1853 family protein [Agarivorans sp. Alg241-V36]
MSKQAWENDLNWCLNAPALLPHALPFAVNQAWQQSWYTALHSQLSQIPDSPAHSRLGLYFEQLWRALIKAHPNWQLLADNVAVQQDGRTQGAIDFLLVNHQQQQLEHWELAIKFYLARNAKPSSYDYLGPNQQDRLSNKLSKLLLKQIPLGCHPQIQTLAKDYPGYSFKQRILLPGYLFQLGSISHSTPQHCHWYTLQQWQNMQTHGWFALTKQQWINPKGHTLEKADKLLDLARGPLQLYLPQQVKQPEQRIFVCPDDWLVRANKVTKP